MARAPADGYTIGYAHVGTLVLHRFLFKQQLYDLDRDIAPIGLVAETPNVIVVNASSPYRDLKGFIDASRAQLERLTMTSADPGTTSEVGVKLFIAQTGAAVRQIPYKATAAQLSDLLGGHVPSAFLSSQLVDQGIRAGRIRPLAVGSKARLRQHPDVPTVAESGVPGFEAVSWFGIWAPARTPRDVLVKINADIQKVFADPDFREKFLDRAMLEPNTGSLEQFTAFIDAEAAKWSKVVKDSGAQVQ